MVECTGLENQRACKRSQGSNPCLSATAFRLKCFAQQSITQASHKYKNFSGKCFAKTLRACSKTLGLVCRTTQLVSVSKQALSRRWNIGTIILYALQCFTIKHWLSFAYYGTSTILPEKDRSSRRRCASPPADRGKTSTGGKCKVPLANAANKRSALISRSEPEFR